MAALVYEGDEVILPDGSRHRVSDLKRTNPDLLVEPVKPEKAASHDGEPAKPAVRHTAAKPDPADVDILGITSRRK